MKSELPGRGLVRVAVHAVSCIDADLDGQPAPGAACVGTVVAAGEEADHLLGTRVAVSPSVGCGECDLCRRGWLFACPERVEPARTGLGALSGLVETRARYATALVGDLDLPDPHAALIPREATDAYALCARAGVGPGERVAVMGAGPTAALTRQLVGLRGAQLVEPGDDQAAGIVVSADGDSHACARAVAMAGVGATVVVLARPELVGPAADDLAGLARRGGAVVGVPAGHPDLVPEVAALVVKGDLDLGAVGQLWQAPGPPLDHLAELGEHVAQAGSVGRALIVVLP